MRLPFLGLLLLISSVAYLACTNDDDSGSEPTRPESTAPATDEPTPIADEPTISPTSAPADGDAAREARAAELCPVQSLDPCTDAYIATVQSSLPGALCVDAIAGTWFWETPGGVPGEPAPGVELLDPCAGASSHIVVELINY